MEESCPQLAILTLSATYRPASRLRQRPFKAGRTRGLLGPAIRDVQCLLPELRCEACILKERKCLYPLLLEGRPLPGGGATVKPFVLHVPWDDEEELPHSSREFGFSMTLFGTGIMERLPHLVAALVRLGERGIGPRRDPLQLLCVDALTPEGAPYHRIWAADSHVTMPDRVSWPLALEVSESEVIPWVEVRFLTPLQAKKQGRPITDSLSFQDMVRRILSRRHNLVKAFCSEDRTTHEVEERLRHIESETLRMARLVPDTRDRQPWAEGRRWSAREKKSQTLGGLLGSARFGPIPFPLLDLLRLGVLMHMGNKTTEGLGAYELVTESETWRPPFWSGRQNVRSIS